MSARHWRLSGCCPGRSRCCRVRPGIRARDIPRIHLQFAFQLTMFTLGINAVYHDCSAALIADGVVLAAAEEERFTHVKHGKRPVPFSTWQLPFHAIEYCLREAGITMNEIDHVAYSFEPELF